LEEVAPGWRSAPKDLGAFETRWQDARNAAETARQEGSLFTKALDEELKAWRLALVMPALHLARRMMDSLKACYAQRLVPPDRFFISAEHRTGCRGPWQGALLLGLAEQAEREEQLKA
jgi:hypothetical protein